jgi:hypothetical protein
MDLSTKVPIPPKELMNRNLSPARESTMLSVFGRPGPLTKECSKPDAGFANRLKRGFDVGPFKTDGLDFAVASLSQVFAEVKQGEPQAYAEVKTAGVLCVRHRRVNPARYSNHSWGASIDLYFGDAVVPQGVRLTHRGVLLLAPFFERHGWYWGAEFSGDSVDSMHFELAEETVLKLSSDMQLMDQA